MKNTNCKANSKLLGMIKNSEFTIAQISTKSGVKERTIMGWIYNGSIPSIENAEKIFNALGFEIVIRKITEEEK